MTKFFLTAVGGLLSVVNPLGTVPIFLGLTVGEGKKAINNTALKTAIAMFAILTFSMLAGKYTLLFFGIDILSLKIAGGLIIMMSGFALLSGNFSSHKGIDKKVKVDAFTKDDPSITPLAIPMLAGPGSITYLIAAIDKNFTTFFIIQMIFVVFIVSCITYLLLKTSPRIIKVIGASGLNAISRIIGFIVVSIGVEYIVSAGTELARRFVTN